MIAKVQQGLALLILGIAAQACSVKEPRPVGSRFVLEFLVTSDDGYALVGSGIATGKSSLGITGSDGRLRVELEGTDGQLLPISVNCPPGYTSPDKVEPLRLARTRRVNEVTFQATHFESTCIRKVREIVVVVRAEAGSGLPIQIDARPAGTTDADGIAHVLVRADRNVKALNLTLDTSAHRDLRPKNPSRTYELAGNDAVLVFDQAFVKAPKPKAHASGVKRRQNIPYRIE
jgi:hypothetical protein